MILKSVILLTLIVLLSEAFHSETFDKNDHSEAEDLQTVQHYESKEKYIKPKKDYYDKKKQHYENGKSYKKQKHYKEADEYSKDDYSVQKNYKNDADKKYKYYESEFKHMNLNEIDDNDYPKDKHSKHNKHPNHFDENFRKDLDHDKLDHVMEKHYEKKHKYIDEYSNFGRDKPNLVKDTDVNYVHHGKAINPNSEFISFEKNFNENYGSVKKVKKDFYKNLKEFNLKEPPSFNDSALTARYIIHNVDWASIATISVRNPIKGAPFANVISMSDGPASKGSGVPFFYMTPLDFSAQDLNKDNRCTITMTLAETSYCERENLDPQDPRCARLILSGKVKRIKPDTAEEEFAKEALFTRHPIMTTWPKDHEWFFSKLKIAQIALLDHFGGATYVDVQDYFNAEQPAA